MSTALVSVSGKPVSTGAAVSVATTTDLAAFDVSTLTAGTTAFVVQDGTTYQLVLVAGVWTWQLVTTGLVLALPVATTTAKGLATYEDPFFSAAKAYAQGVVGAGLEIAGGPPIATNTSSTSFANNNFEGGGPALKTNGTLYVPSQAVFQAPKTSKWFIAFRFKQSAATTAGQYCAFGIHDGSNATYLVDQTGSFATNNWWVQVSDGTAVTADTGVAPDGNWHTLYLSHKGTGQHVVFTLDGVDVASVADTHLSANPAAGTIIASTGVTGYIRKCLVGYDGSAL